MSVLYLTYIPLPTRPPRSGWSSRQVSRDKLETLSAQRPFTTEAADEEKGQIDSHVHVKSDDQVLVSTKERDTEEWRTLRQCAQVLSLCRVRDAMGTGMQPMMGYLRYVPLSP